MVTHTPHFPRFVMADRLVPDLERLKKIFFWSLKIRSKANFLVATKHPKNTLVSLFSIFCFCPKDFSKTGPNRSVMTNREKWGVWVTSYFEKPCQKTHFESCFFPFLGNWDGQNFEKKFCTFFELFVRSQAMTDENIGKRAAKVFFGCFGATTFLINRVIFSLWVWTKHPKNTFAACFMGFGLEWPAREYTIRQIWRKAF